MADATSSDYAALYVPPPSIGHEMGIMFGFIAIMSLSMALYGLAWQVQNKRNTRKEHERVEALRASGWLKEKIGDYEEERVDEGGDSGAGAEERGRMGGDRGDVEEIGL